MRVTTTQMYDNLLTGVNKQLKIQSDETAKVSSGLRFQRPAQAGLDYKMSLDLRHAQAGVSSSLTAVDTATSRLGASQTLLTGMGHLLVRAQTMAVQLANASISAAERTAAATEVQHLLSQLGNDANQQWQGQSLFAGTAIDKPAFDELTPGNFTYAGSPQDRIVAISDSLQVSSNVRGDNPAFTTSFTALKGFETALLTNDIAGIQTALGQLTQASSGMIDLTTEVGGKLSALAVTRQSFDDMSFTLSKSINNHEAADIPAAVAKLQQSSIALQASYSQISQVKSLSLINFLR
ncbi:MAG: hypothetical protein R8K49_06920 [Mariprofundaceae bacterium]